MKYLESVEEAIGNTPLIKLGKISQGLPSVIFGKFEAVNPGGSAKDRIASHIIKRAEECGKLKKGGVIVEATAGNTGAGLAMIAAKKGYRAIFVMPDKMSDDKIALLKAYGAEVVLTKTNVPPDSPENYNNLADSIASKMPNAFRVSQFENMDNPQSHYLSTGREIYEALNGKVDAFVAGIGTGGTISGIGKFLKEKNPRIKIVGADPEGSILSGDKPKPYLVEGIGEDFFPKTLDKSIIDEMERVKDEESFYCARRLAREEGILAGGSSGTSLAAAIRLAKRMPKGSNIVAFFTDTGRNYLSKIFSDKWMSEKGFKF